MKMLNRLVQTCVSIVSFNVAVAAAVSPTELDFNRTGSALSHSELPSRATTGFKWRKDDAETLCWMPQGITGIESATSSTLLVVSWHNDPKFRQFWGCGPQKGSRLSFIDMSDSDAPKYRHVLLVDENLDIVEAHAGGVSYIAGELHVANSNRVDVYDANSIIEVEDRDATFNYRYVLQRESSYSLPGNASFLSYDNSREQFLAGHFTNSSNPEKHTLAWYSPESVQGGEISTQIDADGFLPQMQGAASGDGFLWISAGYEYFPGRLSVARYSPDTDSYLEPQTVTTPPGIEDLYAAKNSSQLWSLTEFTPLQALVVAAASEQTASLKDQRIVIAFDRTTLLPNEPVSDLTEGDQSAPVIDSDSYGNYVVAWAGDHDDDGFRQIFVSAYNAAGEPYFTNLMASNATTKGQHIRPGVALNDQGDVVVVWQDNTDGGKYYDISVVGLTLYGEERFPAFTANTTTKRQQKDPDVAMDNSGNFVIAWEDDNDGNKWYQIYGRGFSRDGTQRFAQRTINAVSRGQQYNPVVAIDEQENVLVFFQDDSNKNKRYNILARGFDFDGVENRSQYRVHADSSGDQRHPAVAMNATGQHVVSWSDDTDRNGKYNIAARVFDGHGSPIAREFVMNEVTSGDQDHPAVSIDALGRGVIAWQDDSDGNGFYDIRVGHLDSEGRKVGNQFTANIVSAGIQLSPAVTLLPDGTSFTIWDNDTQVLGSRVRVISP